MKNQPVARTNLATITPSRCCKLEDREIKTDLIQTTIFLYSQVFQSQTNSALTALLTQESFIFRPENKPTYFLTFHIKIHFLLEFIFEEFPTHRKHLVLRKVPCSRYFPLAALSPLHSFPVAGPGIPHPTPITDSKFPFREGIFFPFTRQLKLSLLRTISAVKRTLLRSDQ